MRMATLRYLWIGLTGVLLMDAPAWSQTSSAPTQVSAASPLEPFSTPYVRTGPPLLRVRSTADRLPRAGGFSAGLPERGRPLSGRVDALVRGMGVLPLKVKTPGGLGTPRTMGNRLPFGPQATSGRLTRYSNLGTLPHRSGRVGRLP